MDFDRGIATSRNPAFLERYGERDILYEQFWDISRTKGGVVLKHNAFDDACNFFDEMMKPVNVDRFDTWIVDSGTTLSEAAMTKAIILLGGSFKGVTSHTHEQAVKHGLVVPKIQDYGSERSMVEQFVDMVITAPKNLVFICHEKEQTDSEGTVRAIVPLLTGKGVEAVCIKFDEVYNIRTRGIKENKKRFIVAEADGLRIAGSRFGVPDGTEFTWDAINASLSPKKEA